ncbi:hypothetical protein [Tardiphaga sp. OK245]|uniref:hypothetical protein n=1 Tax=Tardiphaga sp. OK245 TaxID=1855306 RepID=UPI0008A79947|nr:hypothetical protein [Tardiphaga sp. OK245]SEH87414.1 hypothetical protein SAMN05216367_2471 [Tardiphaga sp. OK245]
MSSSELGQEGLLEKFAMAYRADSGQLTKFCADYPDQASEFLGLAHEITLQKSLSNDAPLSEEDEAWIAEACVIQAKAAPDPFAAMKSRNYAGIREALGIPGVVVNSFRDRFVAVATVPIEFLEEMAREVGTGIVDLVRYLEGPPKLASTTSHKSEGAPQPPSEKMSFDRILQDAGVSEERRRQLRDGV